MATGTPPTTARLLEPISSTKLFVIFSVSAYIRGPVQPVANVELATVAVEVDLKPVTVVIDFVESPAPSGLWISRCPVGV
jgi:hypothetical protein